MHSERCYWWRHIRKLILKEEGVHLTWGDVVHQGLQHLVLTGSVQKAYEVLRENGALAPLERLVEGGDFRSPERLQQVLEAYAPIFEGDEKAYEVLSTEQDIALSLGRGGDVDVEWRGKLDLTLESQEDGKVYILDYKTSEKKVDSSFYTERFHNDQQFTGYNWLGHVLHGDRFGGILVQAIQTTKTIPFNAARFAVTRDEWQTEEWMANVLHLAPKIHEARERGAELYAAGARENEPRVLSLFPIRTGYSENFCDYRHLNNECPDLREATIEQLYETRLAAA